MAASRGFARIYIDCTGSLGPGEPKPESRELMTRFELHGFPTVMFLDPEGNVVEKLCGAQAPEAWLEVMDRLAERWVRFEDLDEQVAGDEAPWTWIRERIGELGAEEFEVRDHATAELTRLREALEAALRLAAQSEDLEVRLRAKRIAGEE